MSRAFLMRRIRCSERRDEVSFRFDAFESDFDDLGVRLANRQVVNLHDHAIMIHKTPDRVDHLFVFASQIFIEHSVKQQGGVVGREVS